MFNFAYSRDKMEKSKLGNAFVSVYESHLASVGSQSLTDDQRDVLEAMIDSLIADRESVVSRMRKAAKLQFKTVVVR